MIVTIDGPAGAGKSSVARALAQRLGFAFLDTGAMYRTVALAALRQNLGWDNPAALAALARRSNIEVREDGTFLDGQDVSQEIRSHEVTSATHYAANNPAVRATWSSCSGRRQAGWTSSPKDAIRERSSSRRPNARFSSMPRPRSGRTGGKPIWRPAARS